MVGFFTDGLDSAGSGLGVLLVTPDVGAVDLSGGTEATADGFDGALSPVRQMCVCVFLFVCLCVMDPHDF